MKWRREVHKDAMAEYATRHPIWEDGEDPAEVTSRMLDEDARKPQQDIQGFLSEEMAAIKEFFEARGLPDPASSVAFNEFGFWSYIVPGDTSPMRRGTATHYVEEFSSPLSRERFLARVADHINYWRRDKATGTRGIMDTDMRLVQIGILLEMVRMRDNHLAEVTEAQAIARGRRRAADAVNREHRDLRAARMREMERLTEKMSVNAAAKNLEARGFGGWQGIKKQWSRHRSKN